MSIVKQSFISNIISKSTYDQFLGYAKVIVAVGSCLLAICIGLSYFFHSSIINWFIQLFTGTSLLFIAYIAAWILILDVQVSVDEPERYAWKESEKVQRPFKYKLTIIWGIILIILGISAIYISNKYRKHYAFECGTYLVDTQQHIYHVDLNDDCDVANEAEGLEEKYGYEIDDSYRLCESCKDFLDEMESYESERYIRR